MGIIFGIISSATDTGLCKNSENPCLCYTSVTFYILAYLVEILAILLARSIAVEELSTWENLKARWDVYDDSIYNINRNPLSEIEIRQLIDATESTFYRERWCKMNCIRKTL